MRADDSGRNQVAASESARAAATTADRPVAGITHTVIVLLAIGLWGLSGKFLGTRVSLRVQPDRTVFYLSTLIVEWLMFALVVGGVLLRRLPLSSVTGPRWRSWRMLLVDVGVAAGFWILSVVLLNLLARALHATSLGATLRAALPRGREEIALWIALSVTAGICEETIFRGYLQHQLIFLTRSSLAGILLSAAAFGAAHAYQGGRMVIVIGVYGALFGG
jgi:membrane protease YdiL (CAAX protease family)